MPEHTYRGAMVDIDGDNDLDIVTVGDAVRLYRNDGTGVFTDISGNIPATYGISLATGDVEGDGDVDVVVGSDVEDQLYRNDGTGVFTADPGALPVEVWRSLDIALEDVDPLGYKRRAAERLWGPDQAGGLSETLLIRAQQGDWILFP